MEGLLSNIVSIIGALLLLSVFVIAHEFGHFFAAKRLGFKVEEFAVGMGPKLFGKTHRGTLFSVRAFPIGGMCRFHGEDTESDDPDNFNAQKVWKRIVVVVAGPLMNLLFALLIATASLMAYGDVVGQSITVADVGDASEQSGLMVGDQIIRADGEDIVYFADLSARIAEPSSEQMILTVIRNGAETDVPVTVLGSEENGNKRMGIQVNLAPIRQRYGLFEAIGGSFRYIGDLITAMFQFFGSIFTQGVQQGDVVGVVGTVNVIGQAVKLGLEVVLYLAVLISVNLAIINLLPLPALDGGRLVFLIIEAIRRKPVPPDKEGMVHFAGFVLLMGLAVLLTISDIRMLAGG